MVRTARCDCCRFWNGRGDTASYVFHGQCRVRHPEVAWSEEKGAVVTMWPEVVYEDWCGEWQEAYRKKGEEVT